MAARKGRGRPPRADRETEVINDLSPEEWELVDFIEEIGPSIARVYIWRIPKHGDDEYIDRVGLDMLKDGAEDFLRDTYGAPCKYRLKFKGSDGKWKLSKTINIGSPDKAAAQGPTGSIIGSIPGGISTKEAELQQELRLIQTRQHETYLALINNINNRGAAAAPAVDPAGMLTAVIGAFTALKSATGSDGGFDLKKFREIIGAVNDLKGETKAVEENMYTVVKELGNKAIETVQGWRSGGGQPAQLTAAPAGPAAAAQPAAVQEQAKMSVQDWIRAQLYYLKQKAMQGKEVGFWIDYVLENEEEPGCRAIIHAIEQGATFEQLLQFDQEIAQNPQLQTWFKALYDGLHTEIKQTVDTGGGSGNAQDLAGNAGTGGAGGTTPGDTGTGGGAG